MTLQQSKAFSDDVLCLEVYGIEQECLSVIDVPGIFKRTAQGVASKADMQMAKSMMQGISKFRGTEIAEEVDPHRQRTLGVLTKPELVDKGAEMAEGRFD
ncbi:uncharacterized protein BP5553_09205 [Venustampulla echinocandica]|uniref:Uncharacterized protein n=1 Tax=Venustampulla echinocandica TaxID=2656787 RepID=A0A370TC23_9HELO|nr:uncharacterized protein BP5553_09205 [Venustampulla echinocandica]RDL31803.1 hypothetical protein BP5553_09205 [Venustampulla echinocandica]